MNRNSLKSFAVYSKNICVASLNLYKRRLVSSRRPLYSSYFLSSNYKIQLGKSYVRQGSFDYLPYLGDHRSCFTLSWGNYYLVSQINFLYFLLIRILFYRRPLNNTPSGTNVQVQLRQRYSWRRGVAPCTPAIIIAQGLIGDSSSVPCYTGTCTGWTSLNTQTACTDFSANLDVSSGEKIDLRTVNLGISFSIGFVSGAWFANLVVGANGNWNLVTRINTATRPDGLLNSSPVATTLPIIYKAIGVTHVHVVQMSDFDGTDVLRCRWSTTGSNFNSYNECGGVCSGVPSATLFSTIIAHYDFSSLPMLGMQLWLYKLKIITIQWPPHP